MNVVRRLSVRVAILAAAILGAGGLVLSAGVATANASVGPAATSAASVSPDFTCPSGDTCFFSGDDYNGTVWEFTNSELAGGTMYPFSYFGIPNPGSAHINGGSTLWVENTANGGTKCVYDGRMKLDHDYNEFWVNYGVDTC
jgi:Peptidase inhibitor family I36